MLLNIERAYEVMERENLDAIVATTGLNVAYVSGYSSMLAMHGFYEAPAAAILPRDRNIPSTLILAEFDLGFIVENPPWVDEIRLYDMLDYSRIREVTREFIERELGIDDIRARVLRLSDQLGGVDPGEYLLAGIEGYLKDQGLSRAALAFDDAWVQLALSERLDGQFQPHPEGSGVFKRIRVVKTEDELTRLRRGAEINQKAIASAIEAVGEGEPWSQVTDAHRRTLTEEGAKPLGKKGLLFGAGDHSWGVFEDDSYVLERGDLVIFDSVGVYDLYHFDCGRTGIVGEPTDEVQGRFDTMIQVIDEIENRMVPGSTTRELRSLGLDMLAKTGFDHAEATLIRPHCIGLDIVELPFAGYASTIKDFTFEAGMAVNYDIYMFAPAGGIHVEHTVVVRDDGVESLYHDLPRDTLYRVG